jgi:hypothetical protein
MGKRNLARRMVCPLSYVCVLRSGDGATTLGLESARHDLVLHFGVMECGYIQGW